MAMLIAFLPFIAFVIVEHLVGTLAGLIAGALISITLLVQGRVRGGQVKVLEAGTALLFTGVAIWGFLGGVESWSIAGVRLRVDLGLLAIVLTSLALSRPFTLQYARERVSEEIARSPHFLNVNMVITSVWAAAFALLVAADLILLYLPNVPTRAAVFITLGALYGAFKFTAWYPEHAAGRSRSWYERPGPVRIAHSWTTGCNGPSTLRHLRDVIELNQQTLLAAS